MKLNWDYRISQKYFDFFARGSRLWGYKIRCLILCFSNWKWNLIVKEWKQLLQKWGLCFIFWRPFQATWGLEANQVYGRKSILVYNTEFHTVSQTSYCDHVQGCLSASWNRLSVSLASSPVIYISESQPGMTNVTNTAFSLLFFNLTAKRK